MAQQSNRSNDTESEIDELPCLTQVTRTHSHGQGKRGKRNGKMKRSDGSFSDSSNSFIRQADGICSKPKVCKKLWSKGARNTARPVWQRFPARSVSSKVHGQPVRFSASQPRQPRSTGAAGGSSVSEIKIVDQATNEDGIRPGGKSSSRGPLLVYPELVSSTTPDVGRFTCTTTPSARYSHIARNEQVSSARTKAPISRLSSLWTSLRADGVSTDAARFVLRSWRSSTNKQYEYAWRQWVIWCNQQQVDPFRPSQAEVINYLSFISSKSSFSVVNTHRSTIVQTLKCFGFSISDELIRRFMKGCFEAAPPKPKYSYTWDVSVLLLYLKSCMPLQDISLKSLTFKLVSLLALVTAQRVQTLKALCISNLRVSSCKTKLVFSLDTILKTTRRNKPPMPVELSKFSDKAICVFSTLIEYLRRTSSKRKSDQLLVSYKTFNAVKTETISRWLTEVLTLSGINTTVFKGHSYRGASTSAAARKGVSVKDIMSIADWSNASTFQLYYHKPLKANNAFVDSILS